MENAKPRVYPNENSLSIVVLYAKRLHNRRMSSAGDFDLPTHGMPVVKPISTRGGARPGSGSKPAGYVKPPEAVDFDKAKARHEAAKADLAELDLKVKSGQYVDREAVRQAFATIFSSFVQTMRSVSDNLERQGIGPEVCVKVDAVLNEAMADVGRDLELFVGAE